MPLELTSELIKAIRECLGDRTGVNEVCDGAEAWLAVKWNGAQSEFLAWRRRTKLTDREKLLIGTLNPQVVGADMVALIQRLAGVEPVSFKK